MTTMTAHDGRDAIVVEYEFPHGTKIEKPTRLRYSWRGGPAEARLDTIAEWTLRAAETGGTILRLTHSGFTARDEFAFDGMGKGWRGKVAARIEEALARAE